MNKPNGRALRTVIVGLDAFDPGLCETLLEQGRLPNLARLAGGAGYARLAVTNPAQSEVSWTSLATGLNPGGHGMFDFVHRDPATYTPYVSLLPTRTGLGGTRFVPPFDRPTLFDHTARQGYPATALWWPATFPARLGSPVNTIPGLGTPDIHGRLGVGTLFVASRAEAPGTRKTRVEALTAAGRGRYTGALPGPAAQKRQQVQATALSFELTLVDEATARLAIGGQTITLQRGQWSPVLTLTFQISRWMRLPVLTRVILSGAAAAVRLYFLPLQLHPLRAPWPYGAPPGFVRKTWQACGPFLTLGWPQDTAGLEEQCIDDAQFLTLCDDIFRAREKVLLHHLARFREGVLAIVFDSLDRLQHMFWKRRPDLVQDWYIRLDSTVGKVRQALEANGAGPAHLLVVSDHGFTDFGHKAHLNRWLLEHGYLAAHSPALGGCRADVDWTRTQAYALGLNSLYLNQAGREGQGIIRPEQAETAAQQLRAELLDWRDAQGRPVVARVATRAEALEGPLAAYGPDLLIGYAPGFRASSRTGLGDWGETALEANHDHWEADHCVDPEAVPGVLFSSWGLKDLPRPSYRDLPALALGEPLPSGGAPPAPPSFSQEDARIVEDRLKSLGYL